MRCPPRGELAVVKSEMKSKMRKMVKLLLHDTGIAGFGIQTDTANQDNILPV